jgi:hypothetical protein
MLDRQTLLLMVVGLCIANGVFSPFLTFAIPVTAVLMPEIFPRTTEWVLFWSSIMLSSATLLFSGVPAALYERVARPDAESTFANWLWLAGAALLSLPAIGRFT